MWDFSRSMILSSSWILIPRGIFWMYLSIPFLKAYITTGIVVAFIPQIRSISISRSFHLDSCSVTFTDSELFLSVGMAISMSRQLFSFLFLMTMSGLLAFISRSVSTGMSHKIVMPSFSGTVWGSCSYHFAFVSRILNRCSSAGMRQLYCTCVDIQFWPAQDILPQCGQ